VCRNERPIGLESETSRRSNICKQHHAFHHEPEMRAAGLQVQLPPPWQFQREHAWNRRSIAIPGPGGQFSCGKARPNHDWKSQAMESCEREPPNRPKTLSMLPQQLETCSKSHTQHPTHSAFFLSNKFHTFPLLAHPKNSFILQRLLQFFKDFKSYIILYYHFFERCYSSFVYLFCTQPGHKWSG
jgi:hypothetical protein